MEIASGMDRWLQENLVCPRDYHDLTLNRNALTCPKSHLYPVVDEIPILLLEESKPTQEEFNQTLQAVRTQQNSPLQPDFPTDSMVDPFVQVWIAATGGGLYKELKGRLSRYPIPQLRLPHAFSGEHFLDLGCNWGRWCLSAAQKGYVPIGIDHNLQAIKAARRVARQLGVSAHYLVADARHLPFAAHQFDVVFSYSVLQHFEKEDVQQTLLEIYRVLHPGGLSLIQMPNLFGFRNLYHQWRQWRYGRRRFDIYYWSPRQLVCNFGNVVGTTSLEVDGFFTLNSQPADVDLLPFKYRLVVRFSELLRAASRIIPGMKYLADSFYVQSWKNPGTHE